MITALLVITAVWISLVIIGYQFLHIRAHAILGYQFLTHAKEIFIEQDMSEQVNVLTNRMLPELQKIRYKVSNRFLWTVLSMVAILMLMVTVIAGTKIWWIEAASGIGVAYVIVSLLSAYKERDLVDAICEACNDDLVKIDRYNEIDVVLDYNKENDPPDDTIDG